jgi:radical SAM protein with 4Fe4S-binding SPASM domain
VASAVNQKGVDVDAVKRFWAETVDNIIVRKYLTWGSQTKLTGDDSADPSPYLDVTKEPCPFPFERLNIDTRGEVIICGFDISSTHRFGNVKEHTIQEIWLGEKFSAWRQKHLEGRGDEIPLCRECPDWQYRSWTHNYWKVVRGAEMKRDRSLSETDMEGMADEASSKDPA